MLISPQTHSDYHKRAAVIAGFFRKNDFLDKCFAIDGGKGINLHPKACTPAHFIMAGECMSLVIAGAYSKKMRDRNLTTVEFQVAEKMGARVAALLASQGKALSLENFRTTMVNELNLDKAS